MKNLITALIFVTALHFSAAAQNGSAARDDEAGVYFETGNYYEILQKAAEEEKMIFVDIYASWCVPCKQMDRNVFNKKKVGRYFNETFINIKVNAETPLGEYFLKRYGVDSFPTYLLIDAEGILLGAMIGGSPPKRFVQQIEQLRLNALESRQIYR